MKQSLIIALSACLLLAGCSEKKQTNEKSHTVRYPEKARDMNIYEVNIRQYTPEGTLNAFSEHLPRLHEMGVDILWLMPVQPISKKNRKGPLGSYYSIQDYTAVNPNFGTLGDFKLMVEQAHKLGMTVILDWVANHTGFDHPWTEIEGYHNTDSAGNIIWPEGTDWTDVADLNYSNQNMRADMIQEMLWWINETDIDGFRCDVAGEVPMDFWKTAIDSLQREKDVFMLAEWDEPKLHEAGFHMTYGWGPHHWLNETAKSNMNTDELAAKMTEDINRYPQDAFRMMFSTNHDENSWNGTVFERYGDGHKVSAVYNFTVYGMPLIYGGQEAGLDKRLRFFDKDTIDWSEIKYEEFYSSLITLKKDNPALFNGDFGGTPEFIEDSNSQVLTFKREKDQNKVIVILNMSDEEQTINIASELIGDHADYFTKETYSLALDQSLMLKPFEYLVFTKN